MRYRFRSSGIAARLLRLAPLALLGASACSSAGKAPAVASSGGQTTYAIHYDDELNAATKAFSDAQARARTLSGGFGAGVDALKKPDWSKVETIITDSDDAGKSADFADASNQAAAFKAFWDADKNEISGRVIGTVSPKLKEAGCGADVSGPMSYALGEALNKQLQKRLRARNQAFVLIERYKTSLGQQNVTALEKLADDVSEASYDVHVAMGTQRARLERLVADKNDVKKSLDRYIKEESDFQAEPGRTEAEKKASSDRVTAANKSKTDADTAGSQAEAMLKDVDKAIDTSTKEYEDALKGIKARVSEKKTSEPTTPAKAAEARPSHHANVPKAG